MESEVSFTYKTPPLDPIMSKWNAMHLTPYLLGLFFYYSPIFTYLF
jgi:hypothetical protein